MSDDWQSFTPHGSTVPWFYRRTGRTIEITTTPGAGTGSPTGNHNQQDKEQ